jgi:GT2 family glycosyltransferase
VADAVASVRSQTESRWDLVVVDDGSTDRSATVAREASGQDPRIRVVQLPNGGVSRARNAGLTYASPGSSYVLFLDGDDELEPAMLARSVKELDRNHTLSMVHSLAQFVDDRGEVLSGTPGMHPRYVAAGLRVRALSDSTLETPFESILALAGIIPSCSLIRRSAFEAVGGWDESFGQGFEDTDLFLRLALQGPIHQIPDRLVRHRRHPGQSSEEPGRHDSQIIKLHRRWRDLGLLAPQHRAVVRDAWHFYDRQLNWQTARSAARRCLREGRPILAARFLAGSSLITARSWLGLTPR